MDTPQPHRDLIDQNRRAWNEVAPRHAAQNFERTRQNLRSAPAYYMNSKFRSCLEGAGVQEKVVAQFNCNNGRELISAVQLGYRKGYGFDFSAEFIRQARDLASGLDIVAEFIETDIYAIPAEYQGIADVIFLTAGALCWMPSLSGYFAAAHKVLRPGGSLVIYETHPILEMFKPDRELGASEPPRNAPHAPRQLEPPRMFGRRLQQAFQPPAQIGRAADIRFVLRIRSVKRVHRWSLWQLQQRGSRIRRI